MQSQQLKSKIISEDYNYQIERLIQQLDHINHIAESGFWISTDEIEVLLNLDNNFIETLEVKSQTQDHRFFWRNFECVLVDRQLERDFWVIKKRENRSSNIELKVDNDSSQKSVHLSTIEDPKLSTNNESFLLSLAPEPEIIPSPYALIDNFLSETQLNDLLRYSINKQPNFVPTTNSASDPNYRRSFYLTHFQEFSELMIKMVREITPQIITHLGINNFAIGQVESQMTAHNHGNYYKIHNDSGSPDSASRVLTYVYYYNREPKAFTGGELVIYDSKIENGYSVGAKSHKIIQPTNNTIVFFPSYCMHEVLPVSCPTEYFADSRFTINGWVRHV